MSRKNNQARKRQRDRLMELQGGLCFHCNQPMTLDGYNDNPDHRHKSAPDNQATFEHLDDKFSRLRNMPTIGRRVVLACRKCNNDRSNQTQQTIDTDELRYRSGKLPRGAIILNQDEQHAIRTILANNYHHLTQQEIQATLQPTYNPRDHQDFPAKCGKLGIGTCSTPSPTSSNTNSKNSAGTCSTISNHQDAESPPTTSTLKTGSGY